MHLLTTHALPIGHSKRLNCRKQLNAVKFCQSALHIVVLLFLLTTVGRSYYHTSLSLTCVERRKLKMLLKMKCNLLKSVECSNPEATFIYTHAHVHIIRISNTVLNLISIVCTFKRFFGRGSTNDVHWHR